MQHPSIIRFPQLREITGYSRSHIDRLEKDNNFPIRVKLGANSVGWYRNEIDEWLDSRQRGFIKPRRIKS